MIDAAEFEHITTSERGEIYTSSAPIFSGVLQEVRELSKKKPEATMSTGKVKLVNRILNDLLVVLKAEPEGKYLELLDDQSLPQMSDAVLVMVQFESALKSFNVKYSVRRAGKHFWVTAENITAWQEAENNAE